MREFVEDRPRCPRCGAAAASPAGCPCRQRSQPAWDDILVLGGYGDLLRDAILRVKRPGSESLAHGLAALFVQKHRDALEAARLESVVPVPMHWWRRACRGTSAAEEIAGAAARALDVDVSSALVRARSTRMQNALPPEERGANVANAFRLRRSVASRRVLLIDDVVTTGATLTACCAVLRAAGASAVHAAAIARADRTFEVDNRGGIA